MAQLLIRRDYDDWELLGLYKNKKQAKEARERFLVKKLDELKAQLEKAREVYIEDVDEDGNKIWDEEDLEWFAETNEREINRLPDTVYFFQVKYGDFNEEVHEED